MNVVYEEAAEAYPDVDVVEVRSDEVEEMEEAAGRVKAWVEKWKADNGVA